jgi:hypothetical protein
VERLARKLLAHRETLRRDQTITYTSRGGRLGGTVYRMSFTGTDAECRGMKLLCAVPSALGELGLSAQGPALREGPGRTRSLDEKARVHVDAPPQ